MSLQINDQAPDFKLINTEKKTVTLSEHKGKNVLLLFFPLAFTSTCTAELCSTRDDLEFYNKINAVVFGISNDSNFVLKKFKESLNLNFELLADWNKTTSEAYGSLYTEFILGMKGVAKRSAFVIDKEGKIKYAEVLEDAGKVPNFDAIKACLEKLN
ncbi:MAG: redoxin domain-containing protein [Sphingobacteriaceae bacterium]|nr:redoxin domain-containing protein [Sphingobacteriaceae bacterium]MBP7807882.1 redoxin domain-containing protein [Bacteroidia bacterium]